MIPNPQTAQAAFRLRRPTPTLEIYGTLLAATQTDRVQTQRHSWQDGIGESDLALESRTKRKRSSHTREICVFTPQRRRPIRGTGTETPPCQPGKLHPPLQLPALCCRRTISESAHLAAVAAAAFSVIQSEHLRSPSSRMKPKAPEWRRRRKAASALHACYPAAEEENRTPLHPPLVKSPITFRAGFLYAATTAGLSLSMCVVSAEAAVSPIVPGRVWQASYPDRPSLLQQLWTSPPTPLLCAPPPPPSTPAYQPLLLLNINPAAAGSGRKRDGDDGLKSGQRKVTERGYPAG